MIRVFLRFLSSYSGTLIDRSICEKVVELTKDSIYEVWLKCSSPSAVLEFVEDSLNKGLVLVELEFLNGVKKKGFQFDLKEISEFGQYDVEVADLITVEFHKKPSEWINILPLKRCRINLGKNKAWIELTKPVKVSTLFDHGLKLSPKNKET